MNKDHKYEVVEEDGAVVEAGLSLIEAEELLCRCCNEDIEAYLSETSGT